MLDTAGTRVERGYTMYWIKLIRIIFLNGLVFIHKKSWYIIYEIILLLVSICLLRMMQYDVIGTTYSNRFFFLWRVREGGGATHKKLEELWGESCQRTWGISQEALLSLQIHQWLYFNKGLTKNNALLFLKNNDPHERCVN